MEKMRWDVVVVGAGPAGALAARESARRGASVLLVDKSAFPRPKVCGGCLSGSALAGLERVGLSHVPDRLGAVTTKRLRLSAGGRSAAIPLSSGAALSRESLDAGLIEEAVLAGVSFLPLTAAALGGVEDGFRRLELAGENGQVKIEAAAVISADGLSGTLLGKESLSETAPGSRIGLGAVCDGSPSFYEPGVIFMACGTGGYAGLVRVERGRLDIAAAVDPLFLKETGGPEEAVASLLKEAGWPLPSGPHRMSWRGTVSLTRRKRRLSGERFFAIGDSAGFVEPFTGEGIAWAIASAAAVAPLAVNAARRWTGSLADAWEADWRRIVQRRQRTCRLVSGLLRRPRLTRLGIRTLTLLPNLSSPVLRAVTEPLW
jgi:flavin-dependent dehydrogenase